MIPHLDKVQPHLGVEVPPQLLHQPLQGQLPIVDHGANLVDHGKEVHHEVVAGVGGCHAAVGGRDILQCNG